MKTDFDYTIIGSGFGGSVSALRLAEKGYKVLVIEKGKWHGAKDFPKSNWGLKKWLWLPSVRWFGIMKITFFRHVGILSGTGVGGGSLVYANTLPTPKASFFTTGSWKRLANWEKELAPFYEIALKMLGAQKNPEFHEGDLALKQLSKEIGKEDQFEAPNVGVFFGEPNVTVSDPYFEGRGPERAGCNFCGGCMTGCRYNAKNTLDKNYLYLAQKLGVEILAENEVYDVKPMGGNDGADGYEIKFKSSTSFFRPKKSVTSKGVIFSGGVLGTIKLLLKLKKTSLPRISDKLGDDVRTNNESLISVTQQNGGKDLSKGVAIGSILHTGDDSHLEVVRYSQGSGFWRFSHVPMAAGKTSWARIVGIIKEIARRPATYLKLYSVKDWAKNTAILLFMQTLDSKLKFKLGALGRMTTSVEEGKKPGVFLPQAVELAKTYGKIISGKETVFALEPLAGITSTAHILGGAVMGGDAAEGVIDKDNRVFGYQNMLVCDGSMISANPGVNPSLSITAITERAMSKIPQKRG